MTIKQILTECEEISLEIRKFFADYIINSVEKIKKEISISFKEALLTHGVSLDLCEIYLETTPRLICDFMDSKNIIILPLYKDGKFSYSINGESSDSTFNTRKEAELDAVFKSIIFYKNVKEHNNDNV